MPIQKLRDYCITQIACGETFSLFVSDHNDLFVSGMLEVDEDVFMQNQAVLSVPHIIPFQEEIKRIAAGTRFALLLTVTGKVYQWGPDSLHPDIPSVSQEHSFQCSDPYVSSGSRISSLRILLAECCTASRTARSQGKRMPGGRMTRANSELIRRKARPIRKKCLFRATRSSFRFEEAARSPSAFRSS